MHRNLSLSLGTGCFAAALLLAPLGRAQVTLSSNPANNATGVSAAAPVVFTFSGPVDTSQTMAFFYSISPFGTYVTTASWTGNTVLTCTPQPPFPANVTISWQVAGYDLADNEVSGTGSFTTGSGGSTGSGTNAITAFSTGKVNVWDQTSAGAPVTDGIAPYYFAASTVLASNRNANYISVTPPGSTATNLTQNPAHPEDYCLFWSMMSSNAFETAFPQGVYTFYVSAAASNQTVQVTLPSGMTQPNPPHINNFAAAQSVDAAQPFTLSWDAVAGGTTADYIYVGVGGAWESPDLGMAGALNGTATSVVIPAYALQPNTSYDAFVGFYRFVTTSNASYTTLAYRATDTQFNLTTVGTGGARPVVTNCIKSGSSFSFDIITTTGQTLTIVSSTNCALPLAQWPILLTTNSPGTTVHISDPRAATNQKLFYRVRNGP